MTDVFHYGLFEEATGRCVCVEESPVEKSASFTFDGDKIIRKLGRFDPDEVYLDKSGAVQKKTSFPVSIPQRVTRHVGETFTILGIPEGTTVTVEGVMPETPITDGELEFGFASPGAYRVYIMHRAHRMCIMTVLCDD